MHPERGTGFAHDTNDSIWVGWSVRIPRKKRKAASLVVASELFRTETRAFIPHHHHLFFLKRAEIRLVVFWCTARTQGTSRVRTWGFDATQGDAVLCQRGWMDSHVQRAEHLCPPANEGMGKGRISSELRKPKG